MKSPEFRHSYPREAFGRIGGFLDPRAFVSRAAPTRLEEVAEPVPPAEGWVLCDTAVSGICGSDTKQIFLHGALDNPLTALLSFPHVLGHEVVARREDSGRRVVLNPWLSCVPRGIDPPCPACAAGRYPWCRNFDRGVVPKSLHLGNCATAPGAHAERFTAHESQLFDVPDAMTDDTAVLADPASVSLRTILLHPPRPVDARARVRLRHPGAGGGRPAPPPLPRRRGVGRQPARRPRRARTAHGRARGADVTTRRPRGRGRAAVRRAARSSRGASTRGSRTGPASSTTPSGARRRSRPRCDSSRPAGRSSSAASRHPSGSSGRRCTSRSCTSSGRTRSASRRSGACRKHAFEHYFDFVGDGLDLTPIITHRFPFDEWKRAVLTIARRKRTGAVKVLLEHSPWIPIRGRRRRTP